MPRKRHSKRTNDGIVIRDQWNQKGREEGSRWLYRAWDPATKRYKSSAFHDNPETDANRKTPGCKAGDDWARDQVASFRLGQDSAAVITLEAAGKSYLERKENRKRSDSQLGIIKFVVAAGVAAGIGDLKDPGVADLTERWLSKLEASPRGFRSKKPPKVPRKGRKPKAEERPAASPRTRNRYLSVLRSVGKHAIQRYRGKVLWNPFDAVEGFTEEKRFRRGYTIAELRILLADDRKADAWWMFIALAAYTGLRSETLRGLTWNMVDWETNRIRVPAAITKTNADVRVPIQPELHAILHATPGVGTSPILPQRIASMGSAEANLETQAYLGRCKITSAGRSVHAFRHTVASLLTATGLSPYLVMDAIGHLSTATSKHYAKGADDYRDQVKAEGWQEGAFYLRRSPPVQAVARTAPQATGSGG